MRKPIIAIILLLLAAVVAPPANAGWICPTDPGSEYYDCFANCSENGPPIRGCWRTCLQIFCDYDPNGGGIPIL